MAIFDLDREARDLERIFGKLEFDDKIGATKKTMSEIMEIIIKNKGIAIPAHVDCSSGLFKDGSASEKKAVLDITELLAFEVIDDNAADGNLYKLFGKMSMIQYTS